MADMHKNQTAYKEGRINFTKDITEVNKGILTHDYFLVARDDPEDFYVEDLGTAGGIKPYDSYHVLSQKKHNEMIEHFEDYPFQGTVVAVSDQIVEEINLKVGDKVLINFMAGYVVPIDGGIYMRLRKSDIWMVIPKKD